MVRVRLAVWVLVLATASGCSQGLERGGEALRTPPRSTAVAPSPTPTASIGSTDGRGGIRVERPRPDAEIFSPVLVRGMAATTSGQVAVRILDQDGTELAATNVEVTCGADCRGAFETQLAFFVRSSRPGTVQVFEPDPDGQIRRVVEVAVTLIAGV